MNHFKERIEKAQKDLDTVKGDIAEIMGIAEAEERDLSEAESLQLEERAAEAERLEKHLHNLELAEKATAERVVEKAAPPQFVQAQHLGNKERKPGELFFKQATAAFIAHCTKSNIVEVAKTAFPGDLALQTVLKSPQEPAAADQAGWAAELVDDAVRGYLDLLRGESMAAQLWAVAGTNVNFDGYQAIKIPGRGGDTSDLESGWTGERDAIPVRSATFVSQTLNPYKWGAITTTSKELVQRSTPQIMSILQQGIVADTATKLDNDYFDESDEIAGYRPRGLYFGVTGTPAATGGASVGEDMLTDIKNLINPIYANNMGQTLRILMHPSNALAMSTVLYNGDYLFRSELSNGVLLGIPVILSTNAPLDELWAVDMAQQAVSSSAPVVEVNDSATLVMIDDDGPNAVDNPAMETTYPRADQSGQVGDTATWNADALNTTKAPIRSLFQTETVAIKSVQYLSWKNLRAGSVNRITGVSY